MGGINNGGVWGGRKLDILISEMFMENVLSEHVEKTEEERKEKRVQK